MGKAEAVRSALTAATDALLAVTLAPRCAACRRVLDRPREGPVCRACWNLVQPTRPPLCRTCGDPLPSWRTISRSMEQCAACRRLPRAIDAGCSAGEYEGALREIIHAFKYEGRRSLATPLGRMLCDASATLLADAACAVPVPLHPWRRVRRGFNQASDLAARLDIPVVHALWRAKATRAQAGLSAAARRRNVRDAFMLSLLFDRQQCQSTIIDHVVVLVDDVKTTGATLDACARVLKTAGAREVRALTVARAAPPDGRLV